MENLEYFDGSLVSSIYTIKDVLNETTEEIDDLNYIYNDKI
jgi:hypothetical protein